MMARSCTVNKARDNDEQQAKKITTSENKGNKSRRTVWRELYGLDVVACGSTR